MGGEQKERNKFLLVWQNITTREEEEESSNSENEVRDSVKAWHRFLAVEVAVSLSPFAIATSFKNISFTGFPSVKRLRSEQFLVQFANQKALETLRR